MITPTWVLLGAVLPAVIGSVVPLVVFYQRCPRWLASIVSVIAVAIGFKVGFMATYGWPKLPPIESHEWLLIVLMPAALVIAIFATVTRIPTGIIWVLRLCLAFGAAPILLQPYIEHTWTRAQSTAWLMGLGVAAALFWVLLLRLVSNRYAAKDDHTPGSWSLLALAIVAGGTGITILTSGSQTLGQLGITLATILIGVAAASLFTRKAAFSLTSHLDLTVTLLIGIWLSGYFYAQLSPIHVILLALAPLTAWFGNLVPGPKHRLRTTLVKLAPVVILVIAVIGSAVMKFTQEATYDAYGRYQMPNNDPDKRLSALQP